MNKQEILKKIEEMIPYIKSMLKYSMTNPDAVGYGKGTAEYEMWRLIGEYEKLNETQ